MKLPQKSALFKNHGISMKIILLFALVLFCVPFVWSEETYSNLKKINDIWLQVNNVERTKSFRATRKNAEGKTDIIEYRKINNNGTKWTRIEYHNSTTIVNEGGTFNIYGNIAIKNEYMPQSTSLMPKMLEFPKATPPEITAKYIRKNSNTFIINGVEFSREKLGDVRFKQLEDLADMEKKRMEGSKNFTVESDISPSSIQSNLPQPQVTTEDFFGIPCYKITTPDTSDTPTNKSLKAVIYEYWIGQNDYFIYRCRAYNAKGNVLFENITHEVTFDPPLDNALFELPPNAKIIIAKTKTQYEEAISFIQPYEPRISSSATGYSSWSWSSLTQSLFQRVEDFFWNHGSLLFLIIGLGCGGLVVYDKIRKARKAQ